MMLKTVLPLQQLKLALPSTITGVLLRHINACITCDNDIFQKFGGKEIASTLIRQLKNARLISQESEEVEDKCYSLTSIGFEILEQTQPIPY